MVGELAMRIVTVAVSASCSGDSLDSWSELMADL